MQLKCYGLLLLVFSLAGIIGCKEYRERPTKLSITCEVWTGYGKKEGLPTEVLLLDDSNRRYYLWIYGDEDNVESYPSIGGYSEDNSVLELRFPLCVEKLNMMDRKELTYTSGVGLTNRKLHLYYRGRYVVSDEELHFRYMPTGINSMVPPEGVDSKVQPTTPHQ